MVLSLTHRIEKVLLNHTRTRGPSVALMRDFFKASFFYMDLEFLGFSYSFSSDLFLDFLGFKFVSPPILSKVTTEHKNGQNLHKNPWSKPSVGARIDPSSEPYLLVFI